MNNKLRYMKELQFTFTANDRFSGNYYNSGIKKITTPLKIFCVLEKNILKIDGFERVVARWKMLDCVRLRSGHWTRIPLTKNVKGIVRYGQIENLLID